MTSLIPEVGLLTGLDSSQMREIDHCHLLHQQVLPAFRQLARAMATEGIELRVVSAWRGFERQAKIWRAKCEGLRPVYDSTQQIVDISTLQGLAKLEAIMLYSALPGASRHHWGTELDIYDAAAVPADYEIQLQPAEYAADGPFHKLTLWLDKHAADYGFFLPYKVYQGGVAAEPWHISYQPLASQYQTAFSLSALQYTLQHHAIAEQQSVLQHLPTLFQRYITNICEA
ncbi:peptidase M15 [Alishewanella longhuensis]|uniref:Peptidase M15 n=1 Tax=Alishewanella longhuensis TaxID=1091037 RepID=A0ABQ3L7K9_9ALTE|nr:M15 family metallopeptidase [Alishewanella longhuensis]GHG70789.1 peptidase M15 [Alishewanella longhuensis]